MEPLCYLCRELNTLSSSCPAGGPGLLNSNMNMHHDTYGHVYVGHARRCCCPMVQASETPVARARRSSLAASQLCWPAAAAARCAAEAHTLAVVLSGSSIGCGGRFSYRVWRQVFLQTAPFLDSPESGANASATRTNHAALASRAQYLTGRMIPLIPQWPMVVPTLNI